MTSPRMPLHLPSILGRMRDDPGPLLLMALVVGLTTALTSAVTPLLLRTSDRALADAVRRAGDRSAVVATFARTGEDFEPRVRDPQAATQLHAAVNGAQLLLPARVAAVLQPGIGTVTTTPLQLLDAGPGRYLTLVYLDRPTGAPRVSYISGGPPRASVGAARARTERRSDARPWPVQVAVSQASAAALGVRTGDRLPAKDDHGLRVVARVSGIFVPRDPGDPAWQTSPQLLSPARAASPSDHSASAAALVSPAALPDLGLAVPPSDLTSHIVAVPRADAVRWSDSADLVRALVSLKASPTAGGGTVTWDTTLDRVVADARAQVAAARGQADVLLVALLVCALLVLWQGADLVVRRRRPPVVLTRERGGTLAQIAAELFVETAACAMAGAAVGLLFTRLVRGESGWAWWVPLPFLGASAAAVTGAVLASRPTDPRRTPANRSARRAVSRGRTLRRVLLVAVVLAAAALSFVALQQRGVLDGGGLTAASAPTWWAVAGCLLVIAVLPGLTSLMLGSSRRTEGGVAFFVAARLRESGVRALPLLVVTVTVAQLTFAVVLTSTEQRGQADGALLGVGGDARVTLAPGSSAADLAHRASVAPGVRAAVAARVEDDVPATSRESAGTVRLVVVDASAYRHLMAVSALPDSPQLDLLDGQSPGGVPALLLGGPTGLRNGLVVHGPGSPPVPLQVVGAAPRVEGGVDPVIVVDADTYARAGGVAPPDTVWAVGPGAATAVRSLADGHGTVALYADALASRRAAPLAAGLVRLA